MNVVAKLPKATERFFPEEVAISWERGPDFPAIVAAGTIDAYVASARAYHERHSDAEWLAEALARPTAEIVELAQRCEEEIDKIALAVLPSRHRDDALRGVVFVPSTESRAYAPFHRGFRTATALWSEPSRDFVYAVTWEALTAAEEQLGATRVALAHLTSGRGHHGVRFDAIVAACMIEVIAHRRARRSTTRCWCGGRFRLVRCRRLLGDRGQELHAPPCAGRARSRGIPLGLHRSDAAPVLPWA